MTLPFLIRLRAVFGCICLAVALPAPSQPLTENWLETRITIENLAAAEAYVAALALGDRLLEQAEAEFDNTIRLAESRLLLASIHQASGDYRAAEDELLAAITAYEAEVGKLSPDLIEPFLLLGDNYYEAEDYAAAIAAWGEARTIGRRNFGLLNKDQLPIIEKMTEAAAEMDEDETARDLQREALVLIERVEGIESMAAMDARFRYAAWLQSQNRASYAEEERRIYYEIERTIKEHYDNDPLLLARVARERAASFRLANDSNSLSVTELRDAFDRVSEMPDPPLLLMAELLVDIGDWQVEFNRSSGREYLQAWELLGELDNGEELREEWFYDLNTVELGSVDGRGLSDDPSDPAGHVVLSFSVTTYGETRDVEIVDSRGLDRTIDSARRVFNNARFRPRIVDGELVDARHIYRLDFRYVPPEEEADSD